ncbi:NAD(P)-dependent dehydrogenase, short-chain alcohol dehydrogenase family [Sphingomonas jatrophae]|uniref:NAD(P)-dependent dehydrogenase, short-chain alcohol dehydrogenase family n=2 Tax=Sphingomonas jatrophae TaxID=1166337 RepID=A0A1I6KG78_9SPHN|nr:NAD(P)-dependent dehydrogenase, short-chain alcohol dehydrogenase family [Sphingomonas jatrophae]
MQDFAGKVALVTGAGSGIGRATAELFATRGASVIVSDVAEAGGRETVSLIEAAGGAARFIRCDVADEAQVAALIAEAIEAYGRIDHAVNNAGIDPELTPEPDWSIEKFDRITGINLRGVFLCMREEIAHMQARGGGGTIVNTGSFASYAGVPNKPAYSASKHAVLGLTRSAGLFYARQGIRINAVCPGGVKTAIMADNLGGFDGGEQMVADNHPIGRVADAAEIADAILWLSGAATFVVGHGLLIDGGLAAG